MIDWLIGLVPQYGAWLLAVSTFLSCLALPIPASVLMLTAGGFIASGDLTVVEGVGGALAGALLGDQVGYAAGRWQGQLLIERLSARSGLIARASAMLAQKGGVAVFLSRWFASALGPYVNVAAGASRQPWPVFTFWDIGGEAVWVLLYVGLGYGFTGNIEAASAMAMDMLGFVAAGMVALGLGYGLWTLIRAESRKQDKA